MPCLQASGLGLSDLGQVDEPTKWSLLRGARLVLYPSSSKASDSSRSKLRQLELRLSGTPEAGWVSCSDGVPGLMPTWNVDEWAHAADHAIRDDLGIRHHDGNQPGGSDPHVGASGNVDLDRHRRRPSASPHAEARHEEGRWGLANGTRRSTAQCRCSRNTPGAPCDRIRGSTIADRRRREVRALIRRPGASAPRARRHQ